MFPANVKPSCPEVDLSDISKALSEGQPEMPRSRIWFCSKIGT